MTSPRSASLKRNKSNPNANLLIFVIAAFAAGFLASSFLSLTYNHRSPMDMEYSRLASSSKSYLHQPQSESPDCSRFRGTDDDNGWSLVHVYYGDASHITDASDINKDYFESNQWFSQVRQDLVVSRLLKGKRKGYFVDLASNDAVRISNTYALETHFGWQGLCLEPNPRYWPGLSYRKCNVVGAVIGQQNMEKINFRFPNRKPAQGGIVSADFDNKNVSKPNEDQFRFTVTLADIFERFGTPSIIDYLSLDIEGAEGFVMQSFPFDRWRFNVLTVERPNAQLSALLRSNGYILLKKLKKWGETIWIHKSIQSSIDETALNIDTENYKYREKTPSRGGR